jgi:hypothetical protein
LKTSIDFETFCCLARWLSIQQAIEPEATRTKIADAIVMRFAAPHSKRRNPMDMLLIIIVLLLLFGGGGYWARGRYW